jgi:hypothetical protein
MLFLVLKANCELLEPSRRDESGYPLGYLPMTTSELASKAPPFDGAKLTKRQVLSLLGKPQHSSCFYLQIDEAVDERGRLCWAYVPEEEIEDCGPDEWPSDLAAEKADLEIMIKSVCNDR